MADWAVDLLGACVVDEVPEGWLTVADLAAQSGMAENTLKGKLNRLERAGEISKKGFRINLNGVHRMVNHYGKK
jgi:DNA-binding IclR family transcriptional regulator